MSSKEQPSVMTKPKHPGRVAQGHKLAALMKQRKELLLNKKPEQDTELESEQDTELIQSSQTWLVPGLILLIGGIAAYIYNRQNVQAPVEIKKIHPKIYME